MGPIDPIRPVRLIRRERRKGEAEASDPAAPVVSVTVNVAPPAPEPPAPAYQPPTNLDAHLIAQNARVRGLRGGQNVLDSARAAYLETEYSGPKDRRAHAGQVTKKQV
ncbi:MAG TPA: hypothetical protein VGG29_09260 [Caulobacteraceae bacterium]|jgi:hypothetical protein